MSKQRLISDWKLPAYAILTIPECDEIAQAASTQQHAEMLEIGLTREYRIAAATVRIVFDCIKAALREQGRLVE